MLLNELHYTASYYQDFPSVNRHTQNCTITMPTIVIIVDDIASWWTSYVQKWKYIYIFMLFWNIVKKNLGYICVLIHLDEIKKVFPDLVSVDKIAKDLDIKKLQTKVKIEYQSANNILIFYLD